MTEMDENGGGAKKGPLGRKKFADLKAVENLLGNQPPKDPSHKSSLFEPNEELIQETTRIKSQRDLLFGRIQKMNQTREKVSKNVYEKVARDYRMQLENIVQLLNEKKGELQKELKKLYMLREKQTMELNRHKEVLEEARFRNYLDEFSEEQYKEVEEFESKEISSIQTELAALHSFIRVHEELFDPEDLGLPARTKESSSAASTPRPEPTRTMAAPPAPRAPKPEPTSYDTFSDKTPLPEKRIEGTPTDHGKLPPKEPPPPPSVDDEFHPDTFYEEKEPSYFDPSGKSSEPLPPLDTETAKTASGLKPSAKGPEGGESHPASPVTRGGIRSPQNDPESILDVFSNVPFESEVSETVSRTGATPAPVAPRPATAPRESTGTTYKLIFTEVEAELDVSEFTLKENVSIGRSPSNDLVLKAAKVSRQHAAINKYKDKFVIIDLKSSNGVFVNGKKVDEQTLEEGDEVSIGGYKMLFKKV